MIGFVAHNDVPNAGEDLRLYERCCCLRRKEERCVGGMIWLVAQQFITENNQSRTMQGEGGNWV